VSAVIAEKAHRGGEEGTEGGMANDADDVDDGVKERRGQIPNKPEENGECVCCHEISQELKTKMEVERVLL
jgi:hypothetical protein